MAPALSESIDRNFSKMPWGTESKDMIGEHDMPLTTVIITIVAAGLLLWLVNRFIPMQGQIKSILNGVGCHRFGSVDCESLRVVSTPQSIPRRALTDRTVEICTASPANLSQQRNMAVF